MAWIEDVLEFLKRAPVCGYQSAAAGASEPTALTALVLAGHDVGRSAQVAGDFLAEIQGSDGSVGVRKGEETPRWPTSLAILAWLAISRKQYAGQVERALTWTLANEGQRMKSAHTGHNTMLSAWPWVEGTHSWVEPSALFTVALKAAGYASHARTQEAVTLLTDRLLPDGGCNYGNTAVLGQLLRPHVQPSGIAMIALLDEFDVNRKIAKTLDYLSASVNAETTTCSLAWAILGLAAHDRLPKNADELLGVAFERTIKRDKSPHKVALIALAALGVQSPIITLARNSHGSR